MGYLTSGNSVVDAMGSLNITGNVIPTIWYKTVLKENGKPYLLAIAILADIVYWYRPMEMRNQATGQILGWKKKFSGDILRQSYQYYADLFGESKKTVKAAIDRLEELCVVRREFRTVSYGEGLISNNVMYLELIPGQLYQLTYPETEPDRGRKEKPYPPVTDDRMGGSLPAESVVSEVKMGGSLLTKLDIGMEEMGGSLPTEPDIGMEEMGESLLTESDGSMEEIGGSLLTKSDGPMEEIGESIPTKRDTPIEKSGGTLPAKWDIPMEKMGGRGVQNGIQVLPDFGGGGDENVHSLYPEPGGVPSQNGRTYTEITSENTPENSNRDDIQSIAQSVRDSGRNDMADRVGNAEACMELVRYSIEYDHHMRYDSPDEKALFEELYAIICEVVCVKRKTIRIGGENYPYELVRERFLRLNDAHLQYVITCMRNTTTKITNIKGYMVTALYNAPMTINHYYQQEVNYDMRGGGWQDTDAL